MPEEALGLVFFGFVDVAVHRLFEHGTWARVSVIPHPSMKSPPPKTELNDYLVSRKPLFFVGSLKIPYGVLEFLNRNR